MIEKIKDLEYPYNLIYVVFGEVAGVIIENADTITDFAGSVEYVLCTLSERERKVLKHRFIELKTYEEIGNIFGVTRERIRQAEATAIRKLRHPNRAKYFKYGVSGMLENIKKGYYNQFVDLESKLIELCKLNEVKANEVINDNELRKKYAPADIADMDLSVRSYNCLSRAGIKTVKQLAELSYYDLTNIRNLGKKGIEEIKERLKEYGYEIRMNGEV